MGSIFESKSKNKTRSLVTPEQQSLFGPLAEFFQGEIAKGFGLERLAGLFEPGFLDPALQGFNRGGGTRDQIQSGFASIGGTLGSRRERTLSDALTNVQVAAQGQFIQQAPALLNALFQPINAANQFALTQSLENITTQSPSIFQQVIGGAGAIIGGLALGGLFAGGGAGAAGGAAGGGQAFGPFGPL